MPTTPTPMPITPNAPTRTFLALLATLLAVPLAGCDFTAEGGPRLDSSADAGELPSDDDDVFAIQTTNDVMKLGLTDDVVYMRFSDQQLEEIDREIEIADGESEGLAARFESAVKGAVAKGLRTRISFDVDDIRDIRWENDRMVVELENGSRAFGDLDVEDEDVTRQFAEDDVREFIERWREVKEERSR